MNKTTKRRAILISCAAVLLVSLFLVLAPYLGIEGIPTWQDLFVLAGINESTEMNDLPMSVHFIDVGQGDCIFAESEGGCVLIDAGERGSEEVVGRYLRGLGVSKIDYVVATHPHSDHIGGMAGIIDEFEIGNIIMPRLNKSLTPTTKTYERFLEAASASGAKIIAARPGSQYTLGELSMTVVGPTNTSDELNNMSVVIRMSYGKRSFIFMGDAQTQEEEDIILSGADIDSDVIKIGHHGSVTSTSDGLLTAVTPDAAVIMCGKDNSYQHPHEEIVEKLEYLNIALYRTDTMGTVIIATDGRRLYSEVLH